MDYTVQGILQTRILEWVAFPFSRGSSQGLNPGLPHCRQILYQLGHKGSPRILEWVAYPFSSGSSLPSNWTGVSCIQADSLPTELSGKLHLGLPKSDCNSWNPITQCCNSRITQNLKCRFQGSHLVDIVRFRFSNFGEDSRIHLFRCRLGEDQFKSHGLEHQIKAHTVYEQLPNA